MKRKTFLNVLFPSIYTHKCSSSISSLSFFLSFCYEPQKTANMHYHSEFFQQVLVHMYSALQGFRGKFLWIYFQKIPRVTNFLASYYLCPSTCCSTLKPMSHILDSVMATPILVSNSKFKKLGFRYSCYYRIQ